MEIDREEFTDWLQGLDVELCSLIGVLWPHRHDTQDLRNDVREMIKATREFRALVKGLDDGTV